MIIIITKRKICENLSVFLYSVFLDKLRGVQKISVVIFISFQIFPGYEKNKSKINQTNSINKKMNLVKRLLLLYFLCCMSMQVIDELIITSEKNNVSLTERFKTQPLCFLWTQHFSKNVYILLNFVLLILSCLNMDGENEWWIQQPSIMPTDLYPSGHLSSVRWQGDHSIN